METRACEEMNEGHLPFFGAPFDSLFNNLSRNPISLIGGLKKKRNFKLDHGHHAIEPNSPTHLESNKRSCLALECVNHKNDAGLAGFLSHAEKKFRYSSYCTRSIPVKMSSGCLIIKITNN